MFAKSEHRSYLGGQAVRLGLTRGLTWIVDCCCKVSTLDFCWVTDIVSDIVSDLCIEVIEVIEVEDDMLC